VQEVDLHDTVTRCRTLVLEGPDGLDRGPLLRRLAHEGFAVAPVARTLPHVDPGRSFRELLTGPGRLAVDGWIIRELVYGPLCRGRSRITWIQALDFAEAVAERDGSLLRLLPPAAAPDAEGAEADDVLASYERAFATLAQHVPVVPVPTAWAQPGARAVPAQPARRRLPRTAPVKLTVC
jgi:hypothetical protein